MKVLLILIACVISGCAGIASSSERQSAAIRDYMAVTDDLWVQYFDEDIETAEKVALQVQQLYQNLIEEYPDLPARTVDLESVMIHLRLHRIYSNMPRSEEKAWIHAEKAIAAANRGYLSDNAKALLQAGDDDQLLRELITEFDFVRDPVWAKVYRAKP